MKYSEKLKDPRWQKKRLKILERDNFSCSLCGDDENMLTVHHLRYQGKDPWNTDDCFLITLCQDCHENWHDEEKQYKKLFDNEISALQPDTIRSMALILQKIKQNIPVVFFNYDLFELFILNHEKELFSFINANYKDLRTKTELEIEIKYKDK